jgi:hypothetical protein
MQSLDKAFDNFQAEAFRFERLDAYDIPNQMVFSLSENERIGCNFFLYVGVACSTSSVLMKLHPAKFTIRLTIYAAALFLSNRWCLAQNCPSTGAVIIDTANEETLDSQYQPYPSPSPAILKRYRFVPPGAWPPNTTFPTVLMVPPNIFKNDMITDDGEIHERRASYDLQFAGFLVFQVETRLAPPGTLPGQIDPGYAPEQTDDLKRQILAAINDSQCNGNIYLVGGSSGGALALWCALDPASGAVSGWDETARSHIKAAVSLSGPSKFCDWTPGSIPSGALTSFENDVDNYVDLPAQTHCDPACDFGEVNCALDQASPAWLVTHGATSNPPPIRLYATDGDPVPYPQADDMLTALTIHYGMTFDVQEWKMSYQYTSNYNHAFKYWPAANDAMGSDGECVHDEVISFLQSH